MVDELLEQESGGVPPTPEAIESTGTTPFSKDLTAT